METPSLPLLFWGVYSDVNNAVWISVDKVKQKNNRNLLLPQILLESSLHLLENLFLASK